MFTLVLLNFELWLFEVFVLVWMGVYVECDLIRPSVVCIY